MSKEQNNETKLSVPSGSYRFPGPSLWRIMNPPVKGKILVGATLPDTLPVNPAIIKNCGRILPIGDCVLDSYIAWYEKQEEFTKLCSSTEVRNLIEKMSEWFEKRYSSETLNNSDFTSNENYNFDYFFSTLLQQQKELLVLSQVIYIDSSHSACLNLSSIGTVTKSELIGDYTNKKIMDEELIGMNISEVLTLFKERDIKIDSDLALAANRIEKKKLIKQGLLEIVMWHIIERGGNIIGPRRAFLFAQEFGVNFDDKNINSKGLMEFIDAYRGNNIKK